MLPTPRTAHVDYDRIYEPAEDSYLLLDTLAKRSERDFLRKRFPRNSPSPVVLEIGTGSGVVLAFATAHANHIFGRSDVLTIGTDVNPFACVAALRTVELAVSEANTAGTSTGFCLGCLEADLATPFGGHAVDVALFNPPYVPTEMVPTAPGDSSVATPFERESQLLALSYAGGVDGMEVTNRLLDQLPGILSRRGVAYILLCAQNKPAAIARRINDASDDWVAQVVNSSGKTAGWERLSILRIWRT
ncbi:hypothetical protein BAUCODRAFT_367034 [Baudoinia panamericana UAMH 10762]|uniref:Methyltransferase small domain-containing protein n=1 Tax=Baudoinia panamericana (strain UAMH 10762) TaxID=717646 RepID=M2NL07_BAUPA|nr:uncharacterized protein BAUCODRAFT_367034 [Baudoinia panamericana UAMH 10762]EMD00160.1 hypothetical protein BAUCODRAFT_367034 [Baudoinia panamericana UAMH 10762]